MAGIVCTALAISGRGATEDASPAQRRQQAALWRFPPPDACRALSLTLYATLSPVLVAAAASDRLSFRDSAAVAITLGTMCTLLSRGSFGGPGALAGRRLRSPEFCLQYFWILWVCLPPPPSPPPIPAADPPSAGRGR